MNGHVLPAFAGLDGPSFESEFRGALKDHEQKVRMIASNVDVPTFENTAEALEMSWDGVLRLERWFSNTISACSDPSLESVSASVSRAFSEHRSEIFLNAELFQRLRGVEGTSEEGRMLVTRTLKEFVRGGAAVEGEEERRRLREVGSELAGLCDEFRRAATEGGPGAGLVNTTLQPKLTSMEDRAERMKLQERSESRCLPENLDRARRIAELRAERAALLGFACHSDLALDAQAVKTAAAVDALLARLAPPAVQNAKREAANLQKFAGATPLSSGDWLYYAEKAQLASFGVSDEVISPYLEAHNVLTNGTFHAAHELFGLVFVERKDLKAYHPDVEVYECFEEDGTTAVGFLLVDLYERPNKKGGAWMCSWELQSRALHQRPVVGVHINAKKGVDGRPTLLTWDLVTTLFHEMGHALHALLCDVVYPHFGCIDWLELDVVEFPSQLNEVWAPKLLRHFAKHWQTGDRIPESLAVSLLASCEGGSNQGFRTVEYLEAAIIDQAWHRCGQSEAGSLLPKTWAELLAFERRAVAKFGIPEDVVGLIPPRYHSQYFSHAFTGSGTEDYASGYYCYIFAEMLDADTADWMMEHGGLCREVGKRYRSTVLSRGGSRSGLDLVRGLLGREPLIEPLLKRRHLI